MRLLVGEKLMLLDSPSEADRAKLFESEAVRVADPEGICSTDNDTPSMELLLGAVTLKTKLAPSTLDESVVNWNSIPGSSAGVSKISLIRIPALSAISFCEIPRIVLSAIVQFAFGPPEK